jgi:hypothetical protein
MVIFLEIHKHKLQRFLRSLQYLSFTSQSIKFQHLFLHIPSLSLVTPPLSTMAPAKLETENHSRDAAFNKAMHKKDKAAQKAAVDEYFKHWDNKAAKDETPETREV